MNLELKFFANFREAVGTKTIEREYPDDADVRFVLEALEDEFPGLDFFDGGEIRSFVRVLKNGRDVEHMAGADTDVDDGDALSLFPPIAGGDGG